MQLSRIGMAGTLESSDVHVVVEPSDQEGIVLHLQSAVLVQFGEQIKQVALDTLRSLEVTNAVLRITDRGALDCTIRARVEAAVSRATVDESVAPWAREAGQ